MKLTIDPEIARARTLPAAFYRDDAWFRRQIERVLAPGWHVYPDTDVPSEPASIRPWTLLPGALDEPLVWTRDGTGTLRLLSNVCTHRGFVIADRIGSARSLRCGYHGRRFELDGRMIGAPCFEGAAEFPSRSDDLPAVAFTRLGPLHLVSLASHDSASALLDPIRARTDFLPWDELAIVPGECREYTIAAHWALYCDNYLEGLHIPYVHPTLNRALDFSAYETELLDAGTLQIGLAPPGDPDVFTLPATHRDHGRPIAGYYFFLYPTTMVNVYPWGISVNVVMPLSVAQTRVAYLTYTWDPSRRGRGAGAGLHDVEHEDDRAVERVAQGLRGRLYDRGRYSPSREQGVHHVHRMLAQALQ